MRILKYTRIFTGISLVMVLVSISNSQEKVRRVEQNKNNYQSYPIEIIGCDIGNGKVLNCSEIVAGGDWWKNLTLSLKNVSSKTISQFNFELSIEKQGQMSLPIPVVLVPQPPQEVYDIDGNRSYSYRLKVPPGEIFKITVVETEYPLKSSILLRRYGVANISNVSFVIQSIFFDDGTRWDFGRWSQIPSGQSVDITQKRVNLPLIGNEPVQITGLRANGKAITPDEAFTGEGEWLKDLSVTFKNTSGRKIRSMTLFLSVFESKPIGPPPGMSVIYGTPRTGKPEKEKITFLESGETGSVTLDATLFERLKLAMAQREALARRTTAQLRIADVWFSDDTSWIGGKFYKVNQAGGIMLDGDGSGKKP